MKTFLTWNWWKFAGWWLMMHHDSFFIDVSHKSSCWSTQDGTLYFPFKILGEQGDHKALRQHTERTTPGAYGPSKSWGEFLFVSKKGVAASPSFLWPFSNDLSSFYLLDMRILVRFSLRSPSSPSFSRGRLYRASLPRLGSFNTGCGLGRWPTGAGVLSGAVSCM